MLLKTSEWAAGGSAGGVLGVMVRTPWLSDGRATACFVGCYAACACCISI
jgi:hypothetical protein